MDETWKKMKKIKCSNTERRLKLKECLSSFPIAVKTFLCLRWSLEPPCWVRRQECSNLKEKLKSALILKGNLKQRRIKNNRLCMYQTLDERHAWRSGLIRDELVFLLSGGDQTLVKIDLQSWDAFIDLDLSWIIFCKVAVMRTFKHFLWCARNWNYGCGRCNCTLTFTPTHTALFKWTEVWVVIINSILVHNY